MSVRNATPEETRAFYGKGLIIFGRKPVPSSNANSTKQEQQDSVSPTPIVPDIPGHADSEKDGTTGAKASGTLKR